VVQDKGGSSTGGNAHIAAVPPPAARTEAFAQMAAAVAGEGGGPTAAARQHVGHINRPWHDAIISMADFMQQLQSVNGSEGGYMGVCIGQLESSVACSGGVGLDTIPASLLPTNYVAEVGDRAQQCLSAGAGVGGECLAVMQEVEGLLQLSGQPVLLQLLGGRQLQELVEGLMRCKQKAE
jgi:hypothetical protein